MGMMGDLALVADPCLHFLGVTEVKEKSKSLGWNLMNRDHEC